MTPCIEHNQATLRYGSSCYKGRKAYMHRIAYCKAHGLELEDIEGQVVRHSCDNMRCYNAEHLSLGTQQDNINDMTTKGRHGRIKFTDEQVAEVRRLHGLGVKQTDLTKQFGISRAHVSKLVNQSNRKT